MPPARGPRARLTIGCARGADGRADHTRPDTTDTDDPGTPTVAPATTIAGSGGTALVEGSDCTVPGVYVTALPPTSDPSTNIGADTWKSACTGGPVESYNDGRYVGVTQTWSSCGGGTSTITAMADRAIDGTFTVYVDVQTNTPDEPRGGDDPTSTRSSPTVAGRATAPTVACRRSASAATPA